ncbi:hypothetical protein B8A45_01525 [Dolosigranulum pigrum]|nr:hypothetical protein B8A45_01525 [Dolosigranulum pigrum]
MREERRMMLAVDITASEWEVMRVVWAKEQTTSATIIKVLSQEMNWKDSTIKTLIGRLKDKGLLDAERDGRGFIYQATVSQQDMILKSGEQWLDRICSTKVGGVLAELIKTSELSQDDLDQIIQVAQTKKADAPKKITCQCIPGQCSC